MPNKPAFAGRAGRIVDLVRESPEAHYDRKAIEKLLNVGATRAQQLMKVMGATSIGKNAVVSKDNLLRYLDVVGGSEADQEKQRVRRFAGLLTTLQQDRTENPPLNIAVTSRMERDADRLDLDHLPSGVELQHGVLTVQFGGGVDLLSKLFAIVRIFSRNLDVLLDRMTDEKMRTA